MLNPSSRVRQIVLIAATALFVGVGLDTVYRSGPHTIAGTTWGSQWHRTDLTVYQEAGRAVVEGENIFEVKNARGWYYMYLPIFAVVMVPFALISTFWASLAWYVLSVLMLVHAVYLSAKLARRCVSEEALPNFWLCTITTVLVLWPAMSGLTRGQASILVTYLVVLSVWCLAEKREWCAGFCLAGSIAMKMFPALLLLFFLWKRRFKLAATTCLWLIVLVLVVPSAVFGVKENLALLHQWLTTIALPANMPEQSVAAPRYEQMANPRIPRNQSVQAVTIRWIAGSTEKTAIVARESTARHVAIALNLALVAISMLACWKGRIQNAEQRMIFEVCIVVLLMLFLAPVSWIHNFSLVVLPCSVAVAAAATDRTFRIALGAFLCTVLLSLAVSTIRIHGGLLMGTMILWSAFVVAMLDKCSRTEERINSILGSGGTQRR